MNILGVIIVDGRSFLHFTGKKVNIKKALLAIDTVPLPEKVNWDIVPIEKTGALTVQIMFKDVPITELGEFLTKLEIAAEKIAKMGLTIDTCPPWPRPYPGPIPKLEGILNLEINIRRR